MDNKQSTKIKSRRKLINPVFHLQTKDEEDRYLTKEMIKQVRQTGQLNLSGRHLANVPAKMFKMYDSDDQKNVNIDFSRPSKVDDEVWWNFKPLTQLDLSSNVLIHLPPEIAMFQDLRTLNLQDNSLESLPKEIGSLTKLTKLILNHNKINELPAEFFKLAELRELSINHNALDKLSLDISDLVMLEKLDFANNHLTELPAGIGFLVRLTELNFSHNKLTSLPPDIVNLRDLLKLDVSHNNLKHLPKMSELRKLQFLYAQHNDIGNIPDFEGCENLQELYLGNNFIKEIEDEFCTNLVHLKILELRDNQIESIPDNVTELAHLIRLDLTNNEIKTLPNSLSLLPHLQTLKVEGNKLKQIRTDLIHAGTNRILKHLREKLEENSDVEPAKISGHICTENVTFPDRYVMQNSNMLNLTQKNLSVIPDECFEEAKEAKVNSVDLCKNKFANLPTTIVKLADYLTELNISANQLKELPDCLAQCLKLKYLNANNNSLSTLPKTFSKLIYLREIAIANNKFDTIPQCIYEMVGLEILIANDNHIDQIEVSGLMKLKRLATLNLSNNNITYVPPELGNVTQLRCLELVGNSFRQPRYAILEQGTESVMSYLRDRIPI